MINSYFDKIYLLNLFKRKDRLVSSKDRLDKLNIKYEVFNGTDGSVLNKVLQNLNNPNFTNPSYLGCAISHLSIYQDAILNKYDRILILEDDNLINQNINSYNFTIPDWSDLFYLGYIPLNDDCSMWDYSFGANSYNIISEGIFKPVKNLWGLFSYGITLNLMTELVNTYNDSFPMELDRYFVNTIQPRGNSIAIYPQLFCCQDNIHSDNLGFAPNNMTIKSVDQRFTNISEYI